jgi:hypothetical protein
MHLRAGLPERPLINRIVLGRDPAITSCKLCTDRIAGAPILMDLNRPRLRFFASCSTGSKLVSGAWRLPQPAAGPANGGGSEVLSVVPSGSSSEAICSERLRIDWNNHRALVRVTLC